VCDRLVVGRRPGVPYRSNASPASVVETVLAASEGQTFHYRYRNPRLLIHGDNRMFLAPNNWSASNSTLLTQDTDTATAPPS
jgi:hypothetical protein